MMRKRIALTPMLIVLFFALVAIPLHSHPVAAASNVHTATTTSAHPTDLVKDNVYLITGSTFITALNATTGTLLWQFQPGGYVDPPTLVNHTVYTLVLNGGTTLYALNATTGATRWTFQPSGYFVNVPVIPVTQNAVYVTTDSATQSTSILYALNPTTGATLWSFPVNTNLGTPVIAHGIVYIGTLGTTSVYARTAAHGKLLWHSQPTPYPISLGNVTDHILYGSSQGPKNSFGITYAFRISDGTFLWSVQGAAWTELNDLVYVKGGTDATPSICALDDGTTASYWCVQGGYAVQVVNGLAYVTTGPSTFVVMRGTDSTPLWSSATAHLLQAVQHAVYVVDNNNFIQALKPANGSLLWRSQMPYGSSAGFVSLNGTLYTASADSLSVYALKAASGTLKWRYSLPSTVSSYSVVHGEVFVVSSSGTIYALAASTGTLLWTH